MHVLLAIGLGVVVIVIVIVVLLGTLNIYKQPHDKTTNTLKTNKICERDNTR